MIEIRTGEVKNAASALEWQRQELNLVREQAQTFAARAAGQPGTEETIYHLKQMEEKLDGINEVLLQFAACLEEVCEAAQLAEQTAADIFEKDRRPVRELCIRPTPVQIHPDLDRIARIEI